MRTAGGDQLLRTEAADLILSLSGECSDLLYTIFIERGLCHSEREMELDSLVGEPRLKKTGDQKTPRGIYHSLLPTPSHPTLRAETNRMDQATFPSSTWPLDLEGRAPSVRFTGDQLALGYTGDLHHQQEVEDHQQGLGEVSKKWTLPSQNTKEILLRMSQYSPDAYI
jgi:hypothetical protein